jgi:hypothetical protein
VTGKISIHTGGQTLRVMNAIIDFTGVEFLTLKGFIISISLCALLPHCLLQQYDLFTYTTLLRAFTRGRFLPMGSNKLQ